MRLFVLTLWDFHSGNAIQAAYLTLEEARQAAKDFILLQQVRPHFLRTYEINKDDLLEVLCETLTWGAGDNRPTLGDKAKLIYERNLADLPTLDPGF